MLQKSALLIVLSAIFVATELAAQSEREVVNQGIEWFSAASSIKFHKKMALMTEGHLRFAQAFDPMQIQLRTGFDVEINKHFNVVPLGYVYTWNPLYGKQPNKYVNNEHRIFEQIVFKHHMARASVSHRLRLEQRFTQVHSTENGEVIYHGYDLYTNRVRYRLNANIPLNKPKIEPGTLFAVLYDELFTSFGKNVTYHDPDQNRVFAGLGYSFTRNCSFQAGPFYQILIKAGGAKQENNVGFSANLTYNFDLSKEK